MREKIIEKQLVKETKLRGGLCEKWNSGTVGWLDRIVLLFFCKYKEDIKLSDSYFILALISRFDDWEKPGSSKRLSIYGKQRVYTKKE